MKPSDVYRKYEGRPAIVMGGGPSAPSQYVFASGFMHAPVLVAANGHANKLGLTPDFIVCKDDVHTETKESMHDRLRPLGAPLVARHPWADIQIPKWPVQGNSGQMALGFAVFLGCSPVVAVGFDCYQGATYFHSGNEKNVSQGIRLAQWISRYRRLSTRLEGAAVRALDGVLLSVFPRYDPAEPRGKFHMPVALRMYAEVDCVGIVDTSPPSVI